MLRAFVEENLSGKALIVVSNREPYVHKKTGLSIKVERPTGGLTSALDDVLRATGGTWVAWGSGSGDRDVVDGSNRIAVPPDDPSYTLKRVWLAPGEADNYYHGYCNQVLWPLCHITLDRVYYRKRFWEDYCKVNRSFADAVLKEAGADTAVWIHDYHLCLVPKMLREAEAGLTIAHFWHIPWPDWSVFRVCPQSREILEALLANDLVGFQIPLFAKNFMDCVRESLDAEIDYRGSTVSYNGRTTKLKAFPISIDFERFDSLASSSRTVRMMKNIREKYRLETRYVGIGVDRLEYTKALIKRLQAVHLFFERYEKFRGKFTFIQIAVPTRMKEPYISYKKTVEDLIARINGKFSRNDWRPIVYIDEKVEQEDLAAYYRTADLAVVSSVYDGMNLVAKEYAASQVDERGALLLSELAGAADELTGAILVNPYDIEGFSDSIREALIMDPKEKAARMAALRSHIREHDIYRWITDILQELTALASAKQRTCCYVFDHAAGLQERFGGRNLFLFLDYDGTLAPIAESPEKASLSHDVRSLLMRVKDRVPVAVISGRGLQDLRDRVGIEGIVYAGNHGAEIVDGEQTVVSRPSAAARPALKELLGRLGETLSHVPGILIEDKGATASVHIRKVNAKYWKECLDLIRKAAKDYGGLFRITEGKKVFEIRPHDAWNKGDAVLWILKNRGAGAVPVYVGDDTTDEDAFRALKGAGVSVAVGNGLDADYYMKNQAEVAAFLRMILALAERVPA